LIEQCGAWPTLKKNMQSRPNRFLLFIGWVSTPLPPLFFAFVICGLFVPAYEELTGKELPRSAAVVMLFLFVQYMHKLRSGYYVTIDDANIYFGRKKEIALPFREITAIITGLPEKMTSTLNANRYLNPEVWASLITERKRALLIINRDGSIVQFNIHKNRNGTSLMQEFANRNRHKTITGYDYDDAQIEPLKWPRWNRLCRSIKIEKAFGDVRAHV
jgi:hypothetical protein